MKNVRATISQSHNEKILIIKIMEVRISSPQLNPLCPSKMDTSFKGASPFHRLYSMMFISYISKRDLRSKYASYHILLYQFFDHSVVIHHSSGYCPDHHTNLNIGVFLSIPVIRVFLTVLTVQDEHLREREVPSHRRDGRDL